MIPATRSDLRLPASAAEIRALQTRRKQHAVRQAMRAPFFRKKLEHVDLARIDDPEEWLSIPILDKDMLRAMSDAQFYEDFCIEPEGDDPTVEFWRSGGSTGRPLFYPRSRRDLEAALEGFARVLLCAGAERPARTHCSFPLGIHPAGQMMARAAQHLGMSVVMAGAGTTTPSHLQLELVTRFGPQVWMGMSSYGLHLANLADHHGIDLARSAVELIICSAEPLSSAKRQKLERAWNARVRDSFGMTEAGMMGAEDGQADGFRIWSDLFFIEVIDPQTRLPVREGEVGGLVVTALATNNVTPFLRWYSGDLVTCRHDVPGAGPFSIFPVLKHAHRTTGFFKIRGVNISHGEFEEFIFSNPCVNDFKCEAVTVGDQDLLRVSVELKRGTEPGGAVRLLCEQVKRTFEISSEIVVLEPGVLAREFESSIKAARMIDRRNTEG